MKTTVFIILSFIISLTSFGQTDSLGVKLKVYNDSEFIIESYVIKFNGIETEFKNINPKSFSDTKIADGLYLDKSYELTLRKNKLIGRDFWINKKSITIDHIGDNKVENGSYLIKLKVNLKSRKNIIVESEYTEE